LIKIYLIIKDKINVDFMDENELKRQIFNLVKKFYEIKHKPVKFIPGKSRINYAGRVFDEKEMINLVDSALDFWLTAGRFEKEFREKLSRFLGVRYVITTNSGSSANLLAISALTSPKLGDKRLKEGDEVITTAAGFPTTINPIIQNRLVPVFVDIRLGDYNADPKLVEEAISDKTKAIFLAHTLGIPFEVDKILKLCKKYDLFLIEDNCDALGAKYNGKYTGTFGDISTLSFYPAHHITTGEGGAVITNDGKLKIIIQSFRDWGRDCWCEPGKDNTCGRRFGWQLGTLPFGYDHKYIYSHLGYNLKMTDMQAAIGVAQLEKLPFFIKKRKENFRKLYKFFRRYEDFFILPEIPKKAEPSPFGFILTIKDGAQFSRKEIVDFLEKNLIQTRMLFGGNIVRQPCMEGIKYRIASELKNADKVMNDTFWIGVYPGINDVMIDYIEDKVKEFFQKLKA
jgi:CDP-4-dehydro-6-deoxyglucose reductase, E1